MRLAVVGLGKLGSCTAAAFAAAGHRVVGVDRDPDVLHAIQRGDAPVAEPGLQELVAAAGTRLTATASLAEAVAASEATFLVVPTPSRPEGDFSLTAILGVIEAIGRALRASTERHVVVITSTVSPGSCDGGIRRALEESSGRVCGDGVGLCYNPEFIALGSVIRDFLHPDVVLIGESDARSGQLVEDVHRSTCRNDPPVARMSLASAELSKLALNTFVTTKISFANLLGEICDALPGADVDDVCRALGLDRRVGAVCLTAGLGYGGPCFPRDNAALSATARSLGISAPIARATDEVNSRLVPGLVGRIRDLAEPGSRVAVLGLAYKPGTRILERSHGMEIARSLGGAGFSVVGWDSDALAREAAAREGGLTRVAPDLDQALAGARVIVVTDRAAGRLVASWLTAAPAGGALRLVVDCWRAIPAACVPAGVRHLRPGIGEAELAPGRRSLTPSA